MSTTGKYGNVLVTHEGINFKSTLERRAYQLYTEAGFKPQYEPEAFVIWDRHVLSEKVTLFKPFKRILSNGRKTLLSITYTPDFIFVYKGNTIIIDTKGKPNDTYPLKIKMFLKHCETAIPGNVYFFEPHNIRQIRQSIDIIKQLPYHK